MEADRTSRLFGITQSPIEPNSTEILLKHLNRDPADTLAFHRTVQSFDRLEVLVKGQLAHSGGFRQFLHTLWGSKICFHLLDDGPAYLERMRGFSKNKIAGRIYS